jgi:hypothetical protein
VHPCLRHLGCPPPPNRPFEPTSQPTCPGTAHGGSAHRTWTVQWMIQSFAISSPLPVRLCILVQAPSGDGRPLPSSGVVGMSGPTSLEWYFYTPVCPTDSPSLTSPSDHESTSMRRHFKIISPVRSLIHGGNTVSYIRASTRIPDRFPCQFAHRAARTLDFLHQLKHSPARPDRGCHRCESLP